ncbi:hypothetical protein SJR89_21400, partial [Aeromonas caviae]|uniref:hypothetical protein n=1 Tax=Aeromonas caviae TaxID=648 RepID=UPI0029DCE950
LPRGEGISACQPVAIAVTPFKNCCDLGSLLPLFAIDKGRRVGDEGEQTIDKQQNVKENREK